MRISTLLVLVLLGTLIVPTAALASQEEQNRDLGPGVQNAPSYPPDQADRIDDADTDLAAGSWLAPILGFLGGLGVGWLIFRRPAARDMDDINSRRAA